MAEVPLLGQGAARARADISEEADGPKIIEASTAFIVAWVNGQVLPITDLNAPVTVDHAPTADEIHGAAAVLMKDRAAEETAQTTALVLQQQAMEMQRRMQQAQLQAQTQQLLAKEKR